jgi:hypothetical protein
MIQLLILLTLLTGCKSDAPKQNTVKPSKSNWATFYQLETQSIDKGALQKIMGLPKEALQKNKNTAEQWIYYDKDTGLQQWAIEFTSNNLVSHIVYIPQEYERSEFSKEALLTHWQEFKCKEHSQENLSPGLIKIVHFFECTGKRKFYFNKNSEVVSVEKF